jgi:outer membrane protein
MTRTFSGVALMLGCALSGVALAEGSMPEITNAPPRPPGGWQYGVAVMAKSQPYRGSGWRVLPFPTLAYLGPRVQWFGPFVSVRAMGDRAAAVALVAAYHFDGYETADDPIFEGLGDRRDTIDAGLRLAADVRNWRTSATLWQDTLDRHGGRRAELTLAYGHRVKTWIIEPGVELELLSHEVVRYYYGVPEDAAREGRPAYSPPAALNVLARLAISHSLPRGWRGRLACSGTRLADEITSSPLVDEEFEWRSMLAFSRSW